MAYETIEELLDEIYAKPREHPTKLYTQSNGPKC